MLNPFSVWVFPAYLQMLPAKAEMQKPLLVNHYE